MVSLYTWFGSRIVPLSPYRLKCSEISRLVILLGLVGLAWLSACHLPRWLRGHLALSPRVCQGALLELADKLPAGLDVYK
jgi:hypothetical protein